MIEVKFGPPKDTFGFLSFLSFLDNVDRYQYLQNYLYGKSIKKFITTDTGIPVYDVFEIQNKKGTIRFKDLNVIVVETLNQFLSISNIVDNTKKYIVLSESYWNESTVCINLEYQLIYIPWDIIDTQKRLVHRSEIYFYNTDLDFFPKYNPKYDFLCLIGRSKPWRNKFVEKLKKNVNLTNTLTSYYGTCLGDENLLQIDLFYDRKKNITEFRNKFYRNVTIPDTIYNFNYSYFTKNEFFYQTKFSLVVETEAELQEYHVTEKTLKCIVIGHPFIIMGTPHYLKYLHSLGFITYSDLFDESYDNICNLDDRIDSVLRLVNDLKHVSFDINVLRKIQQHNLAALTKIRETSQYEKFLNCLPND